MRVALALTAVALAFVAGCGSDTPQELTARGADAHTSDTREVVVFTFSEDVPRPITELPLVRETAWVERSTGRDAAVVDAVRGLLAHRPGRGHGSLWFGQCAPGKDVLAAAVTDTVVTVRIQGYDPDEAGNASCDLSEEGWDAQRQQVAWTVRVATGLDVPVRVVLEDGYETIPATRALESALAQPTEAASSPTNTPAA